MGRCEREREGDGYHCGQLAIDFCQLILLGNSPGVKAPSLSMPPPALVYPRPGSCQHKDARMEGGGMQPQASRSSLHTGGQGGCCARTGQAPAHSLPMWHPRAQLSDPQAPRLVRGKSSFLLVAWTELYPPLPRLKIFYGEALTSNVTELGDRAFGLNEVIRVGP